MAKSEVRRQKALMKKRRKDKLRKKKRVHSSLRTRSSEKKVIYNAQDYPIHECLINPSWREDGLAHILLSRRQADGNIVFGVYLVDIFCLGLKNTFCNGNFPPSEYEKDLKASMLQRHELINCSSNLAHQVIYGAIEYASDLGFKPHKDFKLSKYILEPPDKIEEVIELEFGKDGKPFFVSGPDDNSEMIMRQLEAKVGAENFHYLIEATGDELIEIDEEYFVMLNEEDSDADF